jgi:hypothetical protein
MTSPSNSAAVAHQQLLDLLEHLRTTFDEPGRGWTDETTRAEGYVNLLDLLSTGIDFFVHDDPDRPHFVRMVSETRKFGGDNPDARYDFAPVRPELTYRISGTRGQECYLGICLYGSVAPGSPPSRVIGNVNHIDLGAENGEAFSVVLGDSEAAREGEVVMPLEDDATSVIVRQYFFDPVVERPATLTIEVLDDDGEPTNLMPPPPLDSDTVADRLTAVASHIRGWTDIAPLPPPGDADGFNNICDPHQAAGPWSTPDNLHAYGFYRLADGEGLELRGTSPACTWWGVQLWNPYMQSYDQRYHPAARNNREIATDDDGSWQLVIAPSDPGSPNWLDTAGHRAGFVYFRWQLADAVPPPIAATVVQLS